MTAKEWLSRGRGIDREIEMLERERGRALTDATSATAPMGGERVQTSRRNTSEDKFIRYADDITEIDARIAELKAIKKEVTDVINKLDNATQRMILRSQYLYNETWDETAFEVGYERRQAQRLHKKALRNIEKFLKDVAKCHEMS